MTLKKTDIDKAIYEGDSSKNERCFIWCDNPPGFGLRIYPTGKKSFVLSYRHNKRKRLITIGQYGALTLDQARNAAKKHLASLINEVDPLEARQKARNGEQVKDLCLIYLERHAVKKKTYSDDERRINQHIIPAWGNLKASSIKRSDIAALHTKLGKNNGIYEANRTLALLSKMFNLAELWGLVAEGSPNPAHGVERYKEEKRERFVTSDEMPALIQAIDEEPNQSARFAIWLYLLTGLRKEELLTLKWSDVTQNEIHLKDTKSGKPLHLPVSSTAQALLQNIPRLPDNPYILPGKNSGQHIVNIDKAWRRIRKQAGIDDVRIHDLRRTVGSWLAQSGNSLHLIGRVLNHSNTSTTAIYARFGQDSVRDALEQHGNKIMGAAGLKETAEVIEFKKKG